MPTIGCTPAMWRFVRAWRTAREGRHGAPEARLGPWTATTIVNRGGDLVIAVERQTYLALVFELGAEATFVHAWKRALTTSLRDLGVPLPRVIDETGAGPFRFEPAADERSTAVLSAVEFVCETELHYQGDLAVVQRNLNRFPHDHPPDYTATAAVKRMFRL